MDIFKLKKSEYPFLLKQISGLPAEMDMIGAALPQDHKYLCVVGSRKYTYYGEEVCRKLIEGLKGYPITIVSGLAIGIDSIAHEAALEHGIHTIAFPGSGLGEHALYPEEKRPLAKRIVEAGGTLLSPFKINQKGVHWTFPVRNRLMAGISHATLIIEARKKSGTLLTAGNALEFSRDVLVVPGSIFSDLSYGPISLLKDGATPIFSSKDILEALGFEIQTEKQQKTLLSLIDSSLNQEEKIVVDILRVSSLSGTDLVEKVNMPAAKLNVIISELEIKGVIKESDGMYKIKS